MIANWRGHANSFWNSFCFFPNFVLKHLHSSEAVSLISNKEWDCVSLLLFNLITVFEKTMEIMCSAIKNSLWHANFLVFCSVCKNGSLFYLVEKMKLFILKVSNRYIMVKFAENENLSFTSFTKDTLLNVYTRRFWKLTVFYPRASENTVSRRSCDLSVPELASRPIKLWEWDWCGGPNYYTSL